MKVHLTILLVLVVGVFVGLRFKAKRLPVDAKPKNSITGAVKKVYASQTAVPSKYMEMDRIVREFEEDMRWQSLVDMGDIYARGLFPYLLPNDKVALSCYEIAAKCPDAVVRGNAQAKMTSMKNNPVSEEDRQGKKIHVRYGKSIVDLARKYIDEAHRRQKQKNQATTLETRNSKMRKDINKRNATRHRKSPTTRRRRWLGNAIPDRIGGGSQNTHDHGITSATKSNIARLAEDFTRAGQSFRNADVVVKDVVDMCKSIPDNEISKDELADAHHVIVSLSPDEYSGTGVSQIQILDMAMWKISQVDDPHIQDNLRETLCKRLSSGVENGIVVCGTGKVSRIISIFEGVLQDAQKSISINLVEREIRQIAAKVRKDFLESIGPIGRKAYESDNSVPEYSSRMTKILTERVTEEYIEKLNMKPSVINPLIDVYAEAF